jgi:hypothetical protein
MGALARQQYGKLVARAPDVDGVTAPQSPSPHSNLRPLCMCESTAHHHCQGALSGTIGPDGVEDLR